jgi:hypothetical protein
VDLIITNYDSISLTFLKSYSLTTTAFLLFFAIHRNFSNTIFVSCSCLGIKQQQQPHMHSHTKQPLVEALSDNFTL